MRGRSQSIGHGERLQFNVTKMYGVMNGGDREIRLMGKGSQSDPDHSGYLWKNQWIHLNNCLKRIWGFPTSVGKEGLTHPNDLTQNKTDMHTFFTCQEMLL